MATVYFNDGGTHNISSKINDDVWVDYQEPGMQTTVNLLNGGFVPSTYNLQTFNNGRINLLGGSVVNALYAYDSSQVTISSGFVGQVLYAYNNSQITISGGWASNVLDAYDNSQVTMTSGGVGDILLAAGSSHVTISGGQVFLLQATENGKITMSGGSITGDTTLAGNSILALDGSNFAVDGIPFSSGAITSIYGEDPGTDPVRTLTGTLANGDIIYTPFRIGESGSITLVPEPATILLLGLGGLLLRKR